MPRTALLALLLLATALSGDALAFKGDCDLCTFDNQSSELCTSHADDERVRLKKAKGEFKTADVGDRMRALRSVARLTEWHTNSPSRAVAKFLGEGLKDESESIRAKALELLLDGQHPDETVQILVDQMEADLKQLNKDRKVLVQVHKDRGKRSKKSDALFQKVRYYPQRVDSMLLLMTGLGALPDKRCEEALIDFLQEPVHKAPAILSIRAAGELLNLNSFEGVQAVVAFQDELGKALSKKKIKPRHPVSGGPILLDLWLVLDRELRVDDFDLVAAALAESAKKYGATSIPGQGLANTREWIDWWKQNGSAHSTTLGEDLPVMKRELGPGLGTEKASSMIPK